MRSSAEIVQQCRKVRRHDTCAVRTAVRIHVLHRFFAAVLLKGAIVVVMMRLVLEVHCGVRSAFAVVVRSTYICRRKRVPH